MKAEATFTLILFFHQKTETFSNKYMKMQVDVQQLPTIMIRIKDKILVLVLLTLVYLFLM